MTFWKTYYHLVWTTERREMLIDEQLEPVLYSYLVRKAADEGAYVYAIGGTADHIHLIVAIPPKVSVADLVHRLKGSSAHDINQKFGPVKHFKWQRGYGVISLGERQRKNAEAYVLNQKQHHAQTTVIAWLEQSPEVDEGPGHHGLGQARLREEEAVYEPWGEPPF